VKTDEHRALIDVITAPDIVGRPYVASKSIADDRLALLRKAFDATVADKDFVADATKMDLTVSPMNGADAEAHVRKIYQATPGTIDALKASIK
jgi:tripartite-type tricarboxylate transporter receptor subunit TctC